MPDDPAMEQLLDPAGRGVGARARRVRRRSARATGMTELAALSLLQFADGLFPGRRLRAFARARDLRAGRAWCRIAPGSRRSCARISRAARARPTRWPWRCAARLPAAAGDLDGVARDRRAARGDEAACPSSAPRAGRWGGRPLRVAARAGPATPGSSVLAPSIEATHARPSRRWCSAPSAGRAGVAPDAAAAAYLLRDRGAARERGAAPLPLGQLDGQRMLAALRPRDRAARRRGAAPTRRSTTCGASRRDSSSRACATPSSTGGCSARDSQTAQDRHRRPGRLGQDRADRGALPAAARRARHGRHHQRHLHARRTPSSSSGAARCRAERVVGVETGGCPHTAIREDASVNLEAVRELTTAFPGLDLLLVESGGDNLAATFSPELVDATIYVIDVAEGEKIPRKGGPGITRSDLLVINKIDLAPHVGADLGGDGARRPAHARRAAVRLHQPEERRTASRRRGVDSPRARLLTSLISSSRRPRRLAAPRGSSGAARRRCSPRCRFTLPLQVLAPLALDDAAAVVSVLNPTGARARRRPPRSSTRAPGPARMRAHHALGDEGHRTTGRWPCRSRPRGGRGGGAGVGARPHHSPPRARPIASGSERMWPPAPRLIVVDAFATGRVARGERCASACSTAP